MKNDFTNAKQQLIKKLELFQEYLTSIENTFMIELTELKLKINQSLSNIKEEKFTIAFFGAYSDGKSTLLSMLTKNFNIEISPNPSTTAIKEYEYKDVKLIDTPGLFSDEDLHDERTKKYISEAHLILFTLDPKNPIKDSHVEVIKWLLFDLHKLESTVFILNKMDMVADLYDDKDYETHSNIKSKVVTQEITELAGSKVNPKIICVSIDPYELGLEHWKDFSDEYDKLSRFSLIQELVNDFSLEYRNELLIKAGTSVISDISIRVLNELGKIKNMLESQRGLLENQINEYSERISEFETRANRGYKNIKEEFIALRENILLELDATSNMNEIGKIIQNRLGENGYILEERINLIIFEHTDALLGESKEFISSLNDSLAYHSEVQEELYSQLSTTGKTILKSVARASTRQIATVVLKTRDLLKLPLKFKPWGAIKFAKVIKAMPALMEVLELGFEVWRKYKFEKQRNKVKEELESGFYALISEFTLENYINDYFPFLGSTIKILGELENNRIELDKNITALIDFSSKLEIMSSIDTHDLQNIKG